MLEEWRSIPNHPNYAVSNKGIVKRLIKKGKHLIGTVKQHDANGYKFILVDSRKLYVHRAVALAFIGIPNDLRSEVNHLDGNRSNNESHNLEWVNRSENAIHAVIALKSKVAVLKESDVIAIRELYATGMYSFGYIGEMFLISAVQTSNIVKGKQWSTVSGPISFGNKRSGRKHKGVIEATTK